MSETLHDELLHLWEEAGCPSTRALAQRVGCSHTTIADYLRGDLRSLSILEAIVEALEGDVVWFRTEWTRGLSDDEPEPQGRQRSGRRLSVDVLDDMLTELRAIRKALDR